MNHQKFMARALQLAKNGCGYTSPNPVVGAVLVKRGQIIGEGYHRRYGEQHAEIMAIESATEPPKGAELYCNLEPCCHSTPGKNTPPCTERLIKEGVRKVYISTIDPNSHVNGKGIERLRQANIEVEVGDLSEKAIYLNEAYFKFIQTGLPFVHLKIAASLDGRIATHTGDAKWITDAAALKHVHRLRHSHDAVLVGLNTVRNDNPKLTVRHVEGRQPYRIVLDSHLQIPPQSQLVSDSFSDKTIIFTTAEHDPKIKKILQGRGVRVITVERDPSGRVALPGVLGQLGSMKINSLLDEGGGQVFTQFIRQKLVDKISLFLAPILIGKGIEAFDDLGISRLSEAPRLQNPSSENINHQILIRGYQDLKRTFGCLEETLLCLPAS